jgi:hypothetical protein
LQSRGDQAWWENQQLRTQRAGLPAPLNPYRHLRRSGKCDALKRFPVPLLPEPLIERFLFNHDSDTANFIGEVTPSRLCREIGHALYYRVGSWLTNLV